MDMAEQVVLPEAEDLRKGSWVFRLHIVRACGRLHLCGGVSSFPTQMLTEQW